MDNECCNEACREADNPGDDTPTISAADFGPLADITDPWATDVRAKAAA